MQPPYLVTAPTSTRPGGTENIFVPENDYKAHYLKIWGVAP